MSILQANSPHSPWTVMLTLEACIRSQGIELEAVLGGAVQWSHMATYIGGHVLIPQFLPMGL